MSERRGVEVRLENLQRRYGTVTALDGLTLTLSPGELVALLGPSGCGKTTALRLLAGLEDADGGRVVIGGKDVTGLPANRRNVALVRMEPSQCHIGTVTSRGPGRPPGGSRGCRG